MMRRTLPTLLLSSCVLACTGDLGDEPEPPVEPEPEPILEPKTVPASLDQVTGVGFCVALADGESFQSVSPEGYAWLSVSSGETQHVRVLDPFDEANVTEDDLYLDAIRQVRAWTDGDAAVITEEGLWRLEDMARVQVTPPTDVSGGVLCGDPGTNGELLVGGQLFERRDDQWFVWESGEEGEKAPTQLVDYDGECISTANDTWMMAADGVLWKLTPSKVFWPVEAEAGAQAVATAEMVAVLESEQLLTGPDEWQPWLFDGATPTVMSASGGVVWLGAGEQLVRFDGEGFVEVTHDQAEPIQRIAAHPGGAWLVAEASVCHVSTAPMIRVQGVRAYSRSQELSYPFLVTTTDAEGSVTASIDGEPIDLSVDEETGWLAGTARVDQIGWSEILIESASTSRTVPVKRLPEVTRSWATDIQPIYEEHCTGDTCHGSGAEGPPDIDNYEAWVSLAGTIQNLVVDAQTMPPPSARSAEWGDDQVAIILEWLEGGMLP